MRRWEFHRPILGRLIWGWVAFAILAAVGAGWVAFEQVRKPKIGRVALNMDEELTKLTPPPQSLHLTPPSGIPNVTATAPRAQTVTGNIFPDGENTGALRYAETSLANATTPASARKPSPTNPVKTGPVKYDFPDSAPEIVHDEAPPGELVITIDGRNIDDDPRIHKISGSANAGAIETALPIRVIEPALLQASEYGDIPRIAPDGRRAARYYAFRGQNKPNGKTLAVIVTGLGLNPELTQRAIDELPPSVTLSFAPYTKDFEAWSSKARAKGHEILLELPMEGYDSNTAKQLGPAGLLTSHSPANNLKRLQWMLSRTEGYFGVTNYLGTKFSADETTIRPVIEYLASIGLAYIDDTGAAPTIAGSTAGDIAHILTPATRDGDVSEMLIDFQSLRQKALETDYALGKLAASHAGLDSLTTFLSALGDDGIRLAPASSVLYVGSQY